MAFHYVNKMKDLRKDIFASHTLPSAVKKSSAAYLGSEPWKNTFLNGM